MGLANVKQLVDAELEGRTRFTQWRKTPSQVTTAATWFDLAMSPGSPPPKYWFDAPPAEAKVISQSSDGGIFHGANVSPAQAYARLATVWAGTATALPLTMIMCDYLLYYPSLDDSVLEPQELTNSQSLTRYEDGQGVQVMAVTVAGRTGGQSFNFTYTNQDGVSSRVSKTVTQNAIAAIGTITTSAPATADCSGAFIGLQDGDTGVRSIQSVQMNGADVGLFTLILVKPLFQTVIFETAMPYEKDLFVIAQELPIIKDDAFLNYICLPQGSLAGTGINGNLKLIWN